MATATEEEYMRAFLYLEKKKGAARASDLAAYLGISKAGVSEMLRSLSLRGLLKAKPYSPAKLTRKGLSLAKKMTFKHRVLEVFLSRKLGMSAKSVHGEASRLEHAISDAALRRLYSFLGKPKYDPHGSAISR
jgi:DtxR family Mn-dependent transcriptional regulator